MKKNILILMLFAFLCTSSSAITDSSTLAKKKMDLAQYGNTLNLGLGIGGYYGYYGYIGRTLPVFHINYEFDVAKNFTLAPFVTFYTYSNRYKWGNKNYPDRYYNYRETVIPIGVKGSYYLDDLLKASSKWDFYLAGSIGVAIVSRRWDDGYYGDRDVYKGARSLYLDLHLGTEYHINNKLGLFLDLSTGVSTIGLAIH